MKALLFALVLACGDGLAAAPLLLVPDGQLGQSGCRPGWQPGRQLVARAGRRRRLAARVQLRGVRLERAARAARLVRGEAGAIAIARRSRSGKLAQCSPATRRRRSLPGHRRWSEKFIRWCATRTSRPSPCRSSGTACRKRSAPGSTWRLRAAWCDGLGEARVAFLRGERTREIGQPDGVFRRRAGMLGDAVHGAPLLVGAPSASVQGAGYDGFHARYKARAERSLPRRQRRHAARLRRARRRRAVRLRPERAAAGRSTSWPTRPTGIALTSTPAPARARRCSTASGDRCWCPAWAWARAACSRSTSATRPLRGGMRALWEFAERDDPAIGQSARAPQIAKLKVGIKRGAPAYRYFAVVPSGVNNYGQDAARRRRRRAVPAGAGQAGHGALEAGRQLFPAGRAGVGAGAGQCAGAAGAGDRRRRQRALRLRRRPARHPVALRFQRASRRISSARRCSTRATARGQRQPISHAPRVAYAPGGGYLVLFGTGKLIEDGRPAAGRFRAAVLLRGARQRGRALARRSAGAASWRGARLSGAARAHRHGRRIRLRRRRRRKKAGISIFRRRAGRRTARRQPRAGGRHACSSTPSCPAPTPAPPRPPAPMW